MKKILCLLLGVVVFTACKKEAENSPAPTKTDLLTSKKWRLSAARIYVTTTNAGSTTPTVIQDTDEYATTPACQRDDFSKYNTDKTLVVDEGPTKCGSGGPQTITYSWAFDSDEKQLIVSRAYQTGVVATDLYSISELSASTLRLKQTVTLTSSTGTRYTEITYAYTAF